MMNAYLMFSETYPDSAQIALNAMQQMAGTKPCHLVLFGTIWRYQVLLGAIKRYLALELIIFIFTNN